MRKTVKCTLLATLLWAFVLYAGEFQYNIHYKGAPPNGVSEAQMITSLNSALENEKSRAPYYKAGVWVHTTGRGALDFYEVILYRSDEYSADIYKVTPNDDRGYTVLKDYIPPVEYDEMWEDDRGCPDETVDIVVSAAVDYPTFPLAHQKVDEAYSLLTAAGFNVVKLHYQYATADTVVKYLSCENLKMWARLGHGTEPSKLLVMYNDVYLRPDYFASLNGGLEKKIMLWNSCFVHAEPMIDAVINRAGAYFMAAGNNVTLKSNSSEYAWYNTIVDGVTKGKEFGASITNYNSMLSPYNRYGFTRNPAANGAVYWDDITKPSLTIKSPNGGELYVAESAIDIEWSSNSDGSAAITLISGSSTVETIASSTENDGLYTWDIPKTIEEGDNYRIVITVSQDNLKDTSDATFEIKRKPKIICDTAVIEIKAKAGSQKSNEFEIHNGGLGELTFGVSKTSGTNSVLINEIYIPQDAFFDGMELWNRGADQDMSGWVVEWKDNDNTSGSYKFADGFIFESGATLVLVDDQEYVEENIFYVGKDLSWSRKDGTELSIAIKDKSGSCVDFMKSLGSSATAPDGACWNGDGIELRLQRHQRSSNSDNDDASDWRGENGEANINKLSSTQTLDGIGKSWLSYTPNNGVLSSNEKQLVTISIDPEGLSEGEYVDTIVISHNDPDSDETVRIPVALTVEPNVSVVGSSLQQKDVFGVTTHGERVQYYIPSHLNNKVMTISLYDLQGKKVHAIESQKYQRGLYQLNLGSTLASGSYVCTFESDTFSKAVKIILK